VRRRGDERNGRKIERATRRSRGKGWRERTWGESTGDGARRVKCSWRKKTRYRWRKFWIPSSHRRLNRRREKLPRNLPLPRTPISSKRPREKNAGVKKKKQRGNSSRTPYRRRRTKSSRSITRKARNPTRRRTGAPCSSAAECAAWTCWTRNASRAT